MEEILAVQLSEMTSHELYFCFCGFENCKPLHSFGPAVRPNYIIHYILEGKGIFKTGEQRYELNPGEGFLIVPEKVTFYQADKETPWSYLWIGFAGEAAAQYLSKIGLGTEMPVFRSDKREEFTQIVNEMLECRPCTMANQFRRESLLYEFFHIIAEDIELETSQERMDENKYVGAAVEFIQNNYYNPIKVSQIADYVNINRSYLYLLFRETLGMSPQEYLTNYRVSRARELLTLTDLSIESVAYSCGYRDALVFSKAYKSRMGVPPLKFRKNYRRELIRKMYDVEEAEEDEKKS
ncbi:AraC family transcriptional regulator [Roseburia hominis]